MRVHQGSIQGLKRKLKEMAKEKNELKNKVSKLEGDLLCKRTQMKAMSLHVGHLEEQSRKLAAESESLRVTEREIIALPMNRWHPKQSVKSTKTIVGSLAEQ